MNDWARSDNSESHPPHNDAAGSVFHDVPDSQAEWLRGPVPKAYWTFPEHRRRYLHWAARQLRLRRYEDWYRVTTQQLRRLPGGASLLNACHGSLFAAVSEAFPQYAFQPWLFRAFPRSFWRNPENRRRYMRWLEQRLGITHPDQWYAVTHRDFKRHKGAGMLTYHGSWISEAIKEFRPDHPWLEWQFVKTPKGFWQDRANRVRYMQWLGAQLGFERMEDWYRVRREDFLAHQGGHLLRHYGGSPARAVQDCFPQYSWCEWLFGRVPAGFWDDRRNRERFIRWLSVELNVRRPEDWQRVTAADVRRCGGGGLLHRYRSLGELLQECVRVSESSVGQGREDDVQ